MTAMHTSQPRSPRGFMLVCDGSNGAGKTTLIGNLQAYLEERGLNVVVTREPGGTPVGERIREVLLSPDTPEMCDLTELMLFGAARAQHVREKILPALEAGKVVLCDRFDSATVSFQHYARGIDLQLVNQINALALGGFRPDLYLILDLDPALGLQRVQQRGAGLDRLEAEQIIFLERARDGFLAQAEQDPRRFKVLQADRDVSSVTQDAIDLVEPLIARMLQSGVERFNRP